MAEDREEVTSTSLNRLLLDAARNDNVDQLEDLFEDHEGKFDINFQDGIGNTALHYAALHGSLDALDKLLGYEGCDVDYTNRLEGATPLHLAVKIKQPELRAFIADSLLDAGANPSIRDKNGSLALEYVPEDDKETRNAFRRHQAQRDIGAADIAHEYDDEEDDDEEYSDSDEDDDE